MAYQYPPSNLERVFDFGHDAFRRYIRLPNTRRCNPAELMDLASGMVNEDHPLVVYAGGWAAAEAGLYRPGPYSILSDEQYSFGARSAALETARTAWTQASGGLAEARRGAPPDLAAEWLGFEWRALSALAHLPSMRVIAEWHSHPKPSEQQIGPRLRETRDNLLALGSAVIASAARLKDGEMIATTRGFGSEIAGSLLLQHHRPLRWVVTPGSVRQDHNSKPDLRADLVATAAHATHPRKLIQITSVEATTSAKCLVVYDKKGLVLEGNRTTLDTLRGYIDRCTAARPSRKNPFEKLSGFLLQQLDDFGASQPTTHPM